jgi:hypothetical protein
MRTAIIMSDGNPFNLNTWYYFLHNWIDEVDRVIVSISTTMDDEYKLGIQSICNQHPKIKLLFQNRDRFTTPAELLYYGCEDVEYGNVVFLEDDIFIFEKGVLDEKFKMLESGKYEIIGTDKPFASEYPHLKNYVENELKLIGGFHPSWLFFNIELYKKAKEIYRDFYLKNIENIQFRSTTIEPSLFGDCCYGKNTIFTFFDNYIFDNKSDVYDRYCDEVTTIFGCLIRKLVKKENILSTDEWHEHRQVYDPNVIYKKWIHINEVAGIYGIYGSIRDQNGKPLFNLIKGRDDVLPSELSELFWRNVTPEKINQNKPIFEKRMGYQTFSISLWRHNFLLDLAEKYKNGIKYFIQYYDLSIDNIRKYESSYNRILK